MRSPTWIIAFIRCWLYENRVFSLFIIECGTMWGEICFWCLQNLLNVFGVKRVFVFVACGVHEVTYTVLKQIKKKVISDFHDLKHEYLLHVFVWFFFTVNYTSLSSTHQQSMLFFLLITLLFFNKITSTKATHEKRKEKNTASVTAALLQLYLLQAEKKKTEQRWWWQILDVPHLWHWQ